MATNSEQEIVLEGESSALAAPNLLGRWARFVFRPELEPATIEALLAEPVVYRARRETFIWANDRTIPFASVSIFTAAAGSGICSAFSTGAIALIIGGLIGLVLGLFVFFGYEVVYKTPRRKLELQSQRIAELVAAAERQEGLPGQELVAVQQMLDRSRDLEDKWRTLIPNYPNQQLVDSEFAGWCEDVLSFFARIEVHPLNYSEFKHLTPMTHEANREPGQDFTDDAADDIGERREWLLHFVKRIVLERTQT